VLSFGRLIKKIFASWRSNGMKGTPSLRAIYLRPALPLRRQKAKIADQRLLFRAF